MALVKSSPLVSLRDAIAEKTTEIVTSSAGHHEAQYNGVKQAAEIYSKLATPLGNDENYLYDEAEVAS